MLGDMNACAVVAVKDMAVAAEFYGGKLGLEKGMQSVGGVFYKSGNSGIFVYPSEFAGTNKATAVSWEVADVEGTVKELKAKGVTFEHYDLPGSRLEGDIHVMDDMSMKAVWFKDPDGNILSFGDQSADK